MRIAHLSDLHLYAPGRVKAGDLLGRRVLGAANLFGVRKSLHSEEVAVEAIAEVGRLGVDHSILTGDLANLALPAEYELAARVVGPLGTWDRLTVVPGNHDCYTPESIWKGRFEAFFGHTLWRDNDPAAGRYPVVKDLPGLRIVVGRTPSANVLPWSRGRFGKAQIEAVRVAVEQGRAAGRFVILAFHHNLHRRGLAAEVVSRLRDRDAVWALLADAKPDLVLHGHDHKQHETVVPGTRVPVIGCGSSSVDSPRPAIAARFNVYSVDDGRLSVERWQWQQAGRRFARLPG